MSYLLNYRPWGEFDWIFSRLPATSKYSFLGCVGTEDRCIATYEELLNNNSINNQSFAEIVDIDSEYSSAAMIKRQKNLNKLLSNGVLKRDITEICLLASEDTIATWIEEFLNNTSKVIIDISSFPKRFFFPAIRLLIKQSKIEDLLVTYTLPESYHSGNLAEQPSDWRALPLFGPEEYPDPKYEIAAIGVGFLPFGLPDLLKSEYNSAKPHLFFPFPASPSSNSKTWEFVRQIESSIQLETSDQLIRVNGLDPSDTFDHICYLTENNRKKVLLAPYGPKPMSLGMALYATLTESPVYYTQPKIYHPDYSTGISTKNGRPEIYVYCLKLGGRNLYQFC